MISSFETNEDSKVVHIFVFKISEVYVNFIQRNVLFNVHSVIRKKGQMKFEYSVYSISHICKAFDVKSNGVKRE